MTSVTQVEQHLKAIMEERACVLARETGCIQRERKFSGADRLANVGVWLAHTPGCEPGAVGLDGRSAPRFGERYGHRQALHAGVRRVLASGVAGDDSRGRASGARGDTALAQTVQCRDPGRCQHDHAAR